MKLKINSSVGNKGKNSHGDVKLIRALLNCYLRKNNKPELTILDTSDELLVNTITDFQKSHQKSNKPDGQVTSSTSASFKALVEFMKSTRTTVVLKNPTRGIITWEAEGNEGGRFHSRVLHVPSSTSGLTIGRGYDMKNRSNAEIKKDLIQAGADTIKATTIGKAAGLSGSKAEQFIIDNDLLDFEISAGTQLKIFENVYSDYVSSVKRICNKKRVQDEYGKTDWNNLDKDIIDVLVDLTFRGDYHPNSRKIIQKSVANNDFSEFRKKITNKENWGAWPKDRFERRKEFLDNSAKRRAKLKTMSPKVSVPKSTGTPE
jgi:hypothetical protein